MNLKHIIRNLALLALPLAVATACEGSSSGDTPEGEASLLLEASRTTIMANGSDEVTFKVQNSSKVNVSTRATITMTDPSGAQSRLQGLRFSTEIPGTYSFVASLDGEVSNTVEVSVTGLVEEIFYRRVCMMEITSVKCSFCPQAAEAIKEMKRNRPDRIVSMAFHGAGMGEDPMITPASTALESLFPDASGGYPFVVTDLRAYSSGTLTSQWSQWYNDSRQLYSATCGIKLSSVYDEASNSLKITTGLKTNAGGKYAMAVYVLENGLLFPDYPQSGVDNGEGYVHNEVVRAMLSASPLGDSLGTLEADGEATKEWTVALDEGWKLENLVVVAYATDGMNYINNVVECPADGGSVDYEYNTEE